MKIVGVIVEYNPLHNGHVHHINEIKKQSNADIIIAVISSTFTMRGDLSLFDKFTKTQQALNNNIDIVIELPFVLCVQKADIFAANAVKLLNLLKVDEIWIGSESNDPKLYEKAYKEYRNKEEFISLKMKEGYSYKEITNQIFPLLSNDLLGYSYFKAIKDNDYKINLKTIKRISSNYLDDTPTDSSIASALAIRNNLSMIDRYTPTYVSENIESIYDEEKLFSYIKYNINNNSNIELKNIFFVDEGLENKLKEINSYDNMKSFISHLTTKRYTSTRIKRMLAYILCNIKKEQINSIMNNKIEFIRVLGYNDNGKKYLSKIKKDINIYTNVKEGINDILDIELRLTKIIDTIYNKNNFKKEQGAPIHKE